MAFAGRLTNSNTVVNLMNGLSAGQYEVTILPSTSTNAYLGTDSSSSTTGKFNAGQSVIVQPWKFTWDSNNALYVYFNGSNISIDYILTPVASVGLTVTC